MVSYALALERTGDTFGAAKVAHIPLLTRCRSTALVKSELRMIALHSSLPMTVRVEAATALARKVGGKENEELLAVLQT